MSRLALIAVLVLAGVVSSVTSQPSDSWSPPVPVKLLALIRATLPGAQIVRPEEIDSKSCQPLARSPTVAQADFTGTRRTDFAMLIKLKETGKKTEWQGKILTEAQFALILFGDDGRGGYSTRRLAEFTDFVPLGAFVDVEQPGEIHNASTEKDFTTHHAAVSLIFCEKSETAYYVDGGKVTAVPISD
jgi:hypothetical protein